MQDISIPIDLLHWLAAAAPIIVLAFLLVQLRWTAQQAGTTGMFVAAAVALVLFRTPVDTLAAAGAKGVWDSAPILFVIWTALLLYHVMNKAGGYEALRQGIVSFSRNELFIVVALGWVFTSFLQGIDGFGTPIVVVAPLLVAIGMRPVYAVAIPIIAHIWAKYYGTLGLGWIATVQVVDLDPLTAAATGTQSAWLMVIQVLMGGFTIVWMYGRWAAVRHGWPLILIISAIQGLGQVLVVQFEPVLATFILAAAAMLALYPLSRWRRYAEPFTDMPERPAMRGEMTGDIAEKTAPMGLALSFMPYGVLTVIALGSSLIGRVSEALGSLTIGLPFPEVSTGYGIANSAVASYSPMAPLLNPGTSLLITAALTWVIFNLHGYYKTWNASHPDGQPGLVPSLLASAIPASVPIVAFLVMARIMDHSGQNEALAYGISAIAPAYVYAFMANGIGVIGAFATSSSTFSTTMFSDLQVTMAKLKGLPVSTILAAQNAGSCIGNAIGPANVVLGASTAGISGREGDILRKTLPWTLAAFVLTGAATVLIVMFGA
ncbi:L-lactate permease [Roseovarius sp. SCSIO 43702]|uniref:L-lactate permease n=1 Tax=Roseovarius sp. SCSIO 43702 TaxID=2823043 RepID=UPI001C7328F2|nr:L-lactate permease [Roseovarius sp. SCSIO 43702]QYX56442.1 L-lactate permease [Roseovarius sp. SCSIO 43702]